MVAMGGHTLTPEAMIVSHPFPNVGPFPGKCTQKRQARFPMDALGGVGREPGLASVFNEFPMP